MFAVANGDLSKVKFDTTPRKPYIKISLHGLSSGDVDKYIGAFEDYIDELAEAVETKIPRIL